MLLGKNDARLFFIKKHCSDIFPFLAREIGDYTDHGVEHSKRIVSLIDDISNFMDIDPFSQYLLRASAWLHDIGYILGKNEHYKNSSDLIKEHANELGIQSGEEEDLRWICIAHEIDFDINAVPPRDGKIELRFLAALFRVLDACDIKRDRAPKIVFEIIKDKLPKLSLEHWKANQAIRDVIFDLEKKATVATVSDIDAAQIATDLIRVKIEGVKDQLRGKFPCTDFKIEMFRSAP